MNYNECKVLCRLKRKSEPLISKVPIDEFTEMAQLNFDYEFDGVSKIYPGGFLTNPPFCAIIK